MKFCDRCYEEYEDNEIVQFDKESPKWICLPCKWEFDNRLKFFLIEFFNNQPERSKREDFYGMKAEVDENGILNMENGKKYDLNQPIEDAVL
jgi:hypothetical protein